MTGEANKHVSYSDANRDHVQYTQKNRNEEPENKRMPTYGVSCG